MFLYKIIFVICLIIEFSSVITEKFNFDSTVNNYSEFFNFGDKKLNKLKKDSLENSIIKSKLDVLGEIFKQNIDSIKVNKKLDLIFLIDASSSIGENNFQSEIKFVKKLLSDLTVDYNHTRVAVITFSSVEKVVKHIDEISAPNILHNKCILLNEDLKKIVYAGGGTYTVGAFKAAQEIFENSRNDSRKVLFLITDGFSNGGSPVPIAQELKEAHVTIFTIGIKNGNYKELYELSSTPGEYYSYLLDSFQEFESLARRALHVDFKIGEYVPLGHDKPCDHLCDKGNCCDINAFCACGTTSGHYSCICEAGFYGSGFQNSCLPCPQGSYSNGPNLCLPCPDMHHTTKSPAYSIESCKCKTGYQSTKDNRCEILKCPKIELPDHGYFVKKRECDSVFNSACGIRCEVGYSLVGSSIRLCQLNASWSGEAPSCQIKTCNRLLPPLHGSINCSHSDLGVTYNNSVQNLPVDTVCTFDCEEGKSLIGSTHRTCLPLARWDGLRASCKQIKCSKYPSIQHGKIEPNSCTELKQTYGNQCKIICDPGFTLEGPELKTCTDNHGQWDTNFESTKCKDIEPPFIRCPKNITSSTQLGKKYGFASFSTPEVLDNSGLEVTIWMKPAIKNIESNKFKIGNTQITFFAQDVYGNRAKCIFFVTVEDHEPPTIEDCSDPPTFLSTEKYGANITWDDPNIFDNSLDVKVNRSHNFGVFPFGTTSVTYIATDSSGNQNTCVMNITIEEAQCEAIPDPNFGNSLCLPNDDGMHCVITCQEGYALPLSQSQSEINFLCMKNESIWYNQEGLLYPECSVSEVPKFIEQSGVVTYPTDNCTEANIENLENVVKSSLEENSCMGNCSIDLNTKCEENLEKDNEIRVKRQNLNIPLENRGKLRNRKKKVNIRYEMRNQYINGTQVKDPIFPGDPLVKHNTKKFICPIGYISRKRRCVKCPKGSFHNRTSNACDSCPFGSYNDKLGQDKCIQCPLNHSTRKIRSKKLEECREQCPPGTFAKKKTIKRPKHPNNAITERITLKPYCRTCPVGSYQDQFGQTDCLPCPNGYSTSTSGARSITQCEPTAYQTCNVSEICNGGMCLVENDLEYTCSCPSDYIGTNCEKRLDVCDSNPCLHNGICRSNMSSNTFSCHCTKGYHGKFCEMSDEKCILHCLNGGTCLQNDPNDYFCICPKGFGGDTCEIEISFCDNLICENNGTCIEDNNTFYCECRPGYIGRRCNILPCDYNPCKKDNVCINILEANASRNSYKCNCPPGYSGEFCENKIDFCQSHPCQNNGSCENYNNSFTCICPKLFHGSQCEHRRKTKYILSFEGYTVSRYVKLEGFLENITKFTACLWLKTKDNVNYGTIFSYANQDFDNSLTLTDYGGLTLYINNNYIVTDIVLNDGFWHHFCISWDSSGGEYFFYVDGMKAKNGSKFALNQKILGSGVMVFGQEQDILGGRFSQSESFVGQISEADFWARVLTEEEILTHMNDCEASFIGDLYAWPEFSAKIHGLVKIENSTFCSLCSKPKFIYNGSVEVKDNVAYYECFPGYELHGVIEGKRQCLKSGKWENVYDPYCKKVYCGYPGNVPNGYSIGNHNYDYNAEIVYQCYDGFIMSGPKSITCTKNGSWTPERPKCLPVQCPTFQKPEFGNILFLNEQSFEDVINNFSGENRFIVGAQIEIACKENAELVGKNIMTCLENGTWDFELPQCIQQKPQATAVSCDIDKIPAAPSNGYLDNDSLDNVKNGVVSFVKYKCRSGFRAMGDSISTCIVDGYWTEPNASCLLIECDRPQYKNMEMVDEKRTQIYTFGNMLKFKCSEGYRTLGDTTIKCLPNGKWSRMRGKCTRMACRKPDVAESTTIIGNSYFYEDQITLICEDSKEYNLTCNGYGMWIGDKGSNC